MAPAAVAVPQYAANGGGNMKDGDWNMESALDFDLLAEYLLEDGESGGFDFSGDIFTTTDALTSAPARDPGVVTPNGGSSLADPVSPQVSAQLQQPQVGSQVQQPTIPTQNAVVHPPPPQPQFQQGAQPIAVMTHGRHPPQQPKAAPPQPIAQRPTMQKNGLSMPPMAAQPPNKKPRVASAPVAKGPAASYSFSRAPPAHHLPPVPPAVGGVNNRPKTQDQVDRRRERNRILARRTRLRKKFFFESLQKDVADLQRENAALKSIVRSRLKPDDATALLQQCDANEKLPSGILEGLGPGAGGGVVGMGAAFGGAAGADAEQGVKKLDKEDFSLIQSIQNSQQCFIITDPSLHDNPIVYASDDFLSLTGYSQEEVLGRNCRFLQGTETCQTKVSQIRKAVSAGEDISVTFINYTSDGKPFWNNLFIAALRDADNNIVNFIGVIVKVTGPEKGDSEYGKVLKC